MTIERVLAAATEHNATAPQHVLFRDYHQGRHRYDFASPRFRKSFDWVLQSSQENLCPAVVSAHVDRLSIESWGDNVDDAARHGLDRLANLVHTEAHITGNAFTITWYRGGRREERAAVFHRADQVVPFINAEEPDKLEALAKLWLDPKTGRARMNLIDGELLTRWISREKIVHAKRPGHADIVTFPDGPNTWLEFDDEAAPHEEPHDFKVVPAVWWKRAAPSQFEAGISLLRDVISPQDRLNKLNADAVVSAERIALPIRYVLDVAEDQLRPKLNPATGLMEPPKSPLNEAIDAILMHTAKGPAGQFTGPDADKLLALKNDLEGEIARITGVPMYYLAQTSGDVPSGESLRVVTSRLVSAVSTFQQDATPAWKGQLELLGFENPAIEWADPTPMSETERLAAAETKQRLGYALEDAIADLNEADAEGVVSRAMQSREQSAAAVGRGFLNGQIGY